MYAIRPETSGDHAAVGALHRAAFGDDGVSKLVDDLRQQSGALPVVSLVAEAAGGDPVGHVMLSHAWLDGAHRLIDVMVLSPLGVMPEAQGKGVGTALVAASLEAADRLGAPLLFLEGNHRYYGRRGFVKAASLGFRRPSLRMPENAFQVARLASFDAGMTGTFVYRDVHWRHGVGLYRGSEAMRGDETTAR